MHRGLILLRSLIVSCFFWGGLCSSVSFGVEKIQEGAWNSQGVSWAGAKVLYDAGRYEEALKAFMSQPLIENPNYYFNLGNVYYRMGRYGAALAFYEKAKKLDMRDLGVQKNIQIVRNRLILQMGGQDRLDPASHAIEVLSDRLPLDEVRATIGLLVIVISLIWLRRYLKTKNIYQTFFHAASMLVGTALLLTLFFYATKRYSERTPAAVVLESQVLRSGPGEQFMDLGRLDPGVKIRVLSEVFSEESVQKDGNQDLNPGRWRKIRYSQDGVAWVHDASLLLL